MYSKSLDHGSPMRLLLAGLLLVLAGLLSPAIGQTKRAVLIGNADYENYGYQQNLLFDVNALSASLKAAGFEVDRVIDADLNDLHQTIDAFSQYLDSMADDDVGLFIFSGLVLQGFGTNYLMPIGADTAAEFKFNRSAIDADQAIQKMSGSQTGHRIFVIDARRSDTLSAEFGVARDVSTEMEPPLGSFIAFSNGPLEGPGGAAASPSAFVQTIAAHINRSHTSVEALFASVEDEVETRAGAAQTVWTRSGLLESVSLASPLRPAQLRTASVLEPVELQPTQVASETAGLKRILETIVLDEPRTVSPQSDRSELIEALVAKASSSAATRSDTFIQSITPAEQSFDQVITFSAKLINGSEHVKGRSISQLIQGSPLYPPIAELPKELWENQTCTNCHQWNQANLCVQANTYLRPTGESSLEKRHPYGGSLKANLQLWAQDGCQ